MGVGATEDRAVGRGDGSPKGFMFISNVCRVCSQSQTLSCAAYLR
jgi:hypothetical protein